MILSTSLGGENLLEDTEDFSVTSVVSYVPLFFHKIFDITKPRTFVKNYLPSPARGWSLHTLGTAGLGSSVINVYR